MISIIFWGFLILSLSIVFKSMLGETRNNLSVCDSPIVIPPPYDADHVFITTGMTLEQANKKVEQSKRRNARWETQPNLREYLEGKSIENCYQHLYQLLERNNIPEKEIDDFFKRNIAEFHGVEDVSKIQFDCI